MRIAYPVHPRRQSAWPRRRHPIGDTTRASSVHSGRELPAKIRSTTSSSRLSIRLQQAARGGRGRSLRVLRPSLRVPRLFLADGARAGSDGCRRHRHRRGSRKRWTRRHPGPLSQGHSVGHFQSPKRRYQFFGNVPWRQKFPVFPDQSAYFRFSELHRRTTRQFWASSWCMAAEDIYVRFGPSGTAPVANGCPIALVVGLSRGHLAGLELAVGFRSPHHPSLPMEKPGAGPIVVRSRGLATSTPIGAMSWTQLALQLRSTSCCISQSG